MSFTAPILYAEDTTNPTCLSEGCIPSLNPRHNDCCRCSHSLASTVSARPATRPRDLERERLITREASSAFIDPSALIYHAERRAQVLCGEYVDDPLLVRTDRDRLRDVREELEDARNHLVWHLEDHPDDGRATDLLEALRGIVWVYQKLLAR